jgi:hypothetical protein
LLIIYFLLSFLTKKGFLQDSVHLAPAFLLSCFPASASVCVRAVLELDGRDLSPSFREHRCLSWIVVGYPTWDAGLSQHLNLVEDKAFNR